MAGNIPPTTINVYFPRGETRDYLLFSFDRLPQAFPLVKNLCKYLEIKSYG
jgi:hypothetical protein